MNIYTFTVTGVPRGILVSSEIYSPSYYAKFLRCIDYERDVDEINSSVAIKKLYKIM